MPQMMPLMWSLMILFLFIILLMMITPMIYFLYKPTLSYNSKTFMNKNNLSWNWMW